MKMEQRFQKWNLEIEFHFRKTLFYHKICLFGTYFMSVKLETRMEGKNGAPFAQTQLHLVNIH